MQLKAHENTHLETKLGVVNLATGLDELCHAHAKNVGRVFLFLAHGWRCSS